MIRAFLILSLTLVFFSCADNSSIPSNIIKPQMMQSILWDMIKADVLTQVLLKNDTVKNDIDSTKKEYINKILTIHNISGEQLTTSWTFYKNHPSILNNIIDSLNVQQKRVLNKIPNLKLPMP
ncbi:MAG: DUF4296 domain-containing protein [Chitinophagaceae bacterium]|nr:DUF4296 domain-containing protein [Chitinophagaceae bacterium]